MIDSIRREIEDLRDKLVIVSNTREYDIKIKGVIEGLKFLEDKAYRESCMAVEDDAEKLEAIEDEVDIEKEL